MDGQKIAMLRSPNSDLTLTLALAIISVVATQLFSFKYNGFRSYIKKYFNIKNPLAFFIGIMELISETTKLLSFSFRLFGNIFAGEVLLIIMGFLLPYFIPIPFMFLEIFVGIIQSYIFALLTMSFIKSNIRQL
jgi:F-type H+-transporting ATPase subunit a